ncbi:MAG: hypothetical protein Q4E37_05205 [Tissierellia bacterium]|nr:hypothetical protein [Tissierellia bacterium]
MKRFLHYTSLGLFFLSLILALAIMVDGRATKGKGYGPGAYYYSDIPGWEEIFYPDKKPLSEKRR